MDFKNENDLLTMILDERLDSANMEKAENEIRSAIAQYPGMPYCIDAGKLNYISSSGLRLLLKLRKESKKQLTVLNVSPEVYDIFDVTGFTSLLDVRKRMREVQVDGCEIIGRGAFGTVYRLNGDTVVKVFKGGAEVLPLIETEQNKARQAFLQGIPTAIPFDIVRVGDQYGTVFEMINARSCNSIVEKDPSALGELLPRYAAFLKELHGKEAKPGELASAKDHFLRYLDKVSSVLPETTVTRVRELLCAMPDDPHLIHGDVHLKNVMVSNDEMILIDMDTICTGNPVFEFAGLYACYILFNEDDPLNSEKFFGISKENCTRIFSETLACYLDQPGAEALDEAERKVQTMGCLRFLYILLVEQGDDHSELHELRVRHAADHLTALAFQVNALAL